MPEKHIPGGCVADDHAFLVGEVGAESVCHVGGGPRPGVVAAVEIGSDLVEGDDPFPGGFFLHLCGMACPHRRLVATTGLCFRNGFFVTLVGPG